MILTVPGKVPRKTTVPGAVPERPLEMCEELQMVPERSLENPQERHRSPCPPTPHPCLVSLSACVFVCLSVVRLPPRKRTIGREDGLQGRTSEAMIVVGLVRLAWGPVFAKKGTI